MNRIKKGDDVIVIAGKDKGKQGSKQSDTSPRPIRTQHLAHSQDSLRDYGNGGDFQAVLNMLKNSSAQLDEVFGGAASE